VASAKCYSEGLVVALAVLANLFAVAAIALVFYIVHLRYR
jgi:hypothetical protein